jgi:hypothetical protein
MGSVECTDTRGTAGTERKAGQQMSYGYKKIRARAKQRKWKRAHPGRWKTRYTAAWQLEQFRTYSNRWPVLKLYEPWQYNTATRRFEHQETQGYRSWSEQREHYDKYVKAGYGVYTPGLRASWME